jgi:thiol-disulfide isomerase/thioredoxin
MPASFGFGGRVGEEVRWESPVRTIAGPKRRIVLLGIVATVLSVAAISILSYRAPIAPSVVFTTIGGERVVIADLHGKVVLVNFWATTCAVCMREMPQMVETYRAYAPRGFEVIAVAMPYDRPDWVGSYSRSKALPFRVALDYDAAINGAFGGVEATPTSFLIDKRGRVIRRIVGEPDFAWLRATIESELAKPG